MAARRSILLWLHLLMRPRPVLRDQRIAGPDALARPPGTVVWMHVTNAAAAPGAALIARRLTTARPGLSLVVSHFHDDTGNQDFPPDTQIIQLSVARASTAQLTRLRPDLVLILGTELPPALIVDAHAAGIPLVLADARFGPQQLRRWRFRRGMFAALMSRFERIFIEDQASLSAVARLRAPADRVEVTGPMTEPPEPLGCSEAERVSIATLMQARPAWLATSVSQSEVATVVAAHESALRHAHRMLLILAPDDPATGPSLATTLSERGWIVARRNLEGEPDEDVQIFIADDPSEYGLWYRLAPVSYMGGTLRGDATAPRAPFEAAALGSAVLHGPANKDFAAQYARLTEARAARLVTSEASLGDAVADLIAPDKAAILAHNAWAVTSGGAGVADAVARRILELIDTRARRENTAPEPESA